MTIAIPAVVSLETGRRDTRWPNQVRKRRGRTHYSDVEERILLLDQDGGWTSANKGREGGQKKQGS